MKCLYCQKDLTGKRKGAKFCNDACKRDYHRRGVIISPQITVSNDTDNCTSDTDNDTDNLDKYLDEKYPDIEITPEVEKKLGEIYKKFEKENTGFKCVPCIVRGKRILTVWEKMKLQELEGGDIL